MNEMYQYKSGMIGANIKDVDGKKGIISGYFASFGNVDAEGDVIVKGAFSKTISEWGPQSQQPRIKHLRNHNPSEPLGKLLTLVEDQKGLAYESQIGKHSLGIEFIKMVESGLITEHSIGYITMRKTAIQSFNEYKSNPGKGLQYLNELKLREGSSLTMQGMNPLTPVTGLKGTKDISTIIERQKQIEKFCRNTDVSDETIELLLLHSKQLTQIILDNQGSTAPDDTTLPQNDLKSWFSQINQLKIN